MNHNPSVHVDFSRAGDASVIEAIQCTWIGERVGSDGYLVHPLPLQRIESLIASRNILVARGGHDILAYLVFYRRPEWEALHPRYAERLDYLTPQLRAAFQDRDYVLIDYIAKNRAYRGDAAGRLVFRLRKLVGEWGIGHFLGEISPQNIRSAEFFINRHQASRTTSNRRRQPVRRTPVIRAPPEAF